jgi:hypothetical protein
MKKTTNINAEILVNSKSDEDIGKKTMNIKSRLIS